MLVDDVEAILLISPDAAALREFYERCLELPLEDELHDGVPLHFTCKIGSVHFAIHPADGWPGTATRDAQSPLIALRSQNLSSIVAKLEGAKVQFNGPSDHVFADVISFRDPDGNHVEVLQPKGGT